MSNYVFNSVPTINRRRNSFDLSHSVKTSGNVGTLYPFDVQEVYAGDTMKVDTAVVSRLASQFIRPVMDNLFMDIYYFFVPSRLLYDKYVNVFGENTESAWANEQEYDCPLLNDVSTNVTIPEGSVGDYMGLPTKVTITAPIDVMPFRAFAKIYNEWFRDQNNVPPMHIQTGETASSELANSNEWAPNNYLGKCPKVSKFHDYFTACLPAPQKGNSPLIPVNMPTMLPVVTSEAVVTTTPNPAPMRVRNTNGNLVDNRGISVNTYNSTDGYLYANSETTTGGGGDTSIYPVNLWVNTRNSNSDIEVSDMRYAFQAQKQLERDARAGTRYTEILKATYGVSANDARLQRSEMLSGKRVPLSIHQVVQTTGSGSTSSPLAEVGAFSQSSMKSKFTKSFVENGYVIGVYCIRQFHTYQQGIERMWNKYRRIDFFDPVFQNVSEQPVKTTELFSGVGVSKDTVFGYQPIFEDLRYRPNRVTGSMRSNATNSYDVWHFADTYSSAPVLQQSFIEETPMYVDRAITIPSTTNDQFLIDIYIKNLAIRPLDKYGVPSLIDHN